MPMAKYDAVCWCPGLAGHPSDAGEVQTILLKHLTSRLTAKSLPKVH